MNTFGEYSRYYDLFYRDKNYELEAVYIDQVVKKYSPKAKSILDLGCGTGVHDLLLNKKGYSIIGIDRSENMVQRARVNSSETLEFVQSDIQHFELNRKFDVVMSLFHVISYLTIYDELMNAFNSARSHLSPSGLFIFDFWYGPAVLTNLPMKKEKVVESEELKIIRRTNPVLNPHSNTVDVNFDFEVINKMSSVTTDRFSELHPMRYWFYPELEFSLTKAGFSVISFEEWLSGEKPEINTWNGCIVARLKM